jgi:DNA-binding CsgD family transcriptional regulator
MLTVRERQVARLVRKGHTAREISAVLDISIKTVETHRYNIFKKLGIHSNVQLANIMHTENEKQN